MVVEQSMTVADVAAGVRDDRFDDLVRDAVVRVARELMESEITAEIGAGRGEVAPEQRVSHRNGYRPRAWETRVGEVSSCWCRASGPGSRTSRRFWNRASGLSRRSSRSCWRLT